MNRNVAILGATGSIGTATIDVLGQLADEGWRAWGVSGHANLDALATACEKMSLPPEWIVGSDPGLAAQFDSRRWPSSSRFESGAERLVALASADEVGVVVAAIVGRAGLESTLAAVEAGKRVALANKETLVVAGTLVCQAQQVSGAEILPVDSEHSAIFQCLQASQTPAERIILTASGGPFRDWTREQMEEASVAAALNHPTWKMGPKISVDSATMMNKALEIIEARWLFDIPAESIEVMIHPQSVIHSMVEFVDGSVVAQLSPPDMRLPIQYALTYPDRVACSAPRFDVTQRWDLSLEPADRDRFPALELGFEVAAVGGTAGAVVNAANEAAVALFLDQKIRFTEIVPACRKALENHSYERHPTLQRLIELDEWARAEVQRWHCGANF
ncbi:1-deoxy-D-xylulose 5-phosphate reductoisomerase [Roseimaritima multifibrata]|uniref:1-deoxy-D-xylulose 5-phosphate reductoisomerase n=1 Tax=Roseimaritima multifibrata TaxID=1930274 RepID=A0A517MCZ2_9BACT|nr:1-deoxy-D-xylulose-5-phosphate reductoisomerase [Roseimaritima multifibrata]QDS92758.1 1-deoxy-D-xylulose 5-phosphate reductoisomerase [Roseimaritima multifibrata]